MSKYIVMGVRREPSADATHEHISEVCTQGPIHFTRAEVIDSIGEGNTFWTLAIGGGAELRVIDTCPHDGCSLAPYIATDSDGTKPGNLDGFDPY